ncbi:hypothetical protein L7F22_048114 [Adiantum nelumboides]|nr:hypothetical protein [Adiantum nelumboides]
MAVEHASELASIVASYLRKHGFTKSHSAFLRENGVTVQETDVADLETLYELYISTQANGTSKAKKSRTTEFENGPASLDKGVKSDGKNASASLFTNGGITSVKKKKKHRKQLSSQSAEGALKDLSKSKFEENQKDDTDNTKHRCKRKRVKEIVDNSNQDSGNLDSSPEKLKEVEGVADEDVEKHNPVDVKAKKKKNTSNSQKNDVRSYGENGSASLHTNEGISSEKKKKKHRKELPLQCAEDGLKEPAKSELEENQNDNIDTTKHSGKRRVKEKVDAGKNSNQDSSILGSSSEKVKEVEGVADEDVEMHKSVDAKAKKKKDTPNNQNTPTGALAFKRVEVEKVSFSDPRLGDNSYWAKDGAEEGYGAKAQEVLGLVRGRDFRHEKTKKKRGSYRGGIIGLQSHSIKFDNSDED